MLERRQELVFAPAQRRNADAALCDPDFTMARVYREFSFCRISLLSALRSNLWNAVREEMFSREYFRRYLVTRVGAQTSAQVIERIFRRTKIARTIFE